MNDFAVGSIIRFKFNTRKLDQTPVTFSGSPTVAVYKDSVTESTAGITQPTVDYDSVIGLNYVVIDTSADGAFYVAGKDYEVVITSGTIDGKTVVGEIVYRFSLNNRPVQSIAPSVVTALSASNWEVLTSGFVTAGSIGKHIIDFLNFKTGDLNTNLAAAKTVIDATKSVVDATKLVVDGHTTTLDEINGSLVIANQGISDTYQKVVNLPAFITTGNAFFAYQEAFNVTLANTVNNQGITISNINDNVVDLGTNLTDTIDVSSKLLTMLQADGLNWKYTSAAVSLAPAGGGNTTTILVNPIQAIIPERLLVTELYLFNNEIVTQPIGFVDEDGVPIDITGLSFTFKIKAEDGTVINNQAGITGTGNTVVVTIPAITPGTKCTSWSIRLTSTGKVWRHGPVIFKDVP